MDLPRHCFDNRPGTFDAVFQFFFPFAPLRLVPFSATSWHFSKMLLVSGAGSDS